MIELPVLPAMLGLMTTVAEAFQDAWAKVGAGRLAEAEAIARALLDRDPNQPDFLNLLGVVAINAGQPAAAVAILERLTADAAGFADAWLNLAHVRRMLRLDQAALTASRHALALDPGGARALAGHGMGLRNLRVDSAAVWCRRAVSADPQSADSWQSLGLALELAADPQYADQAFGAQLSLAPGDGRGWASFARQAQLRGNWARAERFARRALRLNPVDGNAHLVLGQVLLVQERFSEGIPHFEDRLRDAALSFHERHLSGPFWQGEPLAGRTILLHDEQGLGDTLHGLGFVPQVAALGARVVLRVMPVFAAIAATVPGVAELQIDGPDCPLPRYDCHARLLSVMAGLGWTPDRHPPPAPYINADPMRLNYWRAKLGPSSDRMRCGLIWAGNPAQATDHFRSPGLDAVWPLLALDGIEFLILQVGPGRQDVDRRSLPPNVRDLGAELRDLGDTAAVMSLCDLVVSSDTGPAHLAGALGRPLWLMLSAAPDWRWFLGRKSSPWYPASRLYRQQALGDWAPVIANVQQDLMERR